MKAELIFMGVKQKNNSIFEKKNQNGRLRKTEFFNSPILNIFFAKKSGIGPWVTQFF